LNDGQIPTSRFLRVALGMGYNSVEGNRRASRNGLVSDSPPEIPNVTIRSFSVAVNERLPVAFTKPERRFSLAWTSWSPHTSEHAALTFESTRACARCSNWCSSVRLRSSSRRTVTSWFFSVDASERNSSSSACGPYRGIGIEGLAHRGTGKWPLNLHSGPERAY
jgi:hypothetical protein